LGVGFGLAPITSTRTGKEAVSASDKYRTIVADPPWEISRRMGIGGRRQNETVVPYSFMPLDEIKSLPVVDLADDHSILFLWATRRAFREGYAVAVARAWGFEPSGELIWGLRNPGLGSRWIANDHEPVLVATRGPVAASLRHIGEPVGVYFWKQVYEYGPAGVPQKKHSAKPPGFMEFVEQHTHEPRLELFAREQRLGWDTWGDEALGHVTLGDAA
jgi:N6-adenosine-specific RNA methylase IME4